MKLRATVLVCLFIVGLFVVLPRRTARSQDETDGLQEARIRELLVERRDTLRQLLEAVAKQTRSGTAPFDDVIRVQVQLFDAELALTSNREERLQIHENRVKVLRQLEEIMKTRNVDGVETFDKVLVARAARLEAEILLVREQLSTK